jgi:hypothetical protein
MPVSCSRLALEISAMMPVTRCTLVTTSSIVLPASFTSLEPSSTCLTVSSISVLLSFAALAERCARCAVPTPRLTLSYQRLAL